MTIVETYFQEEVTELLHEEDKLQEWHNEIEKLGLTGQTEIKSNNSSPVPFVHMKPVYKAIFETLCPAKVRVEDYNITPIPLEGIKLVSLAKAECYFTHIYVWYDNKNPDPVLVGERKKIYWMDASDYGRALDSPDFLTTIEAKKWLESTGKDKKDYRLYNWGDGELYLMARWGDEKRTMEELHSLAVKRYRTEQG